MKEIRQIGTQAVIQNGTSLVILPPQEWLAEHKLKDGDFVYPVLKMDEIIRYHLTEQPRGKKSKVRPIGGNGWLTLNAKYAKKLGIKKGDPVGLSIDGDVLMVWRVG